MNQDIFLVYLFQIKRNIGIIFIFFQDIDECDLSLDGCSQICNNNNGSYTCACSDGFVLDPADNATCNGEYCK